MISLQQSSRAREGASCDGGGLAVERAVATIPGKGSRAGSRAVTPAMQRRRVELSAAGF
jgi:hypothetical protein